MVTRRHVPFISAALALTAAACSSATQQAARDGCVLAPADSALLAAGPLYTACEVETVARARTTPVNFTPPPTASYAVQCLVADVQLVVAPDGMSEPGTARIISTNDAAFGGDVLASVGSWRFEPATLGGEPVRQLVRRRHVYAVQTVVVAATAAGAPRSRTQPPRQRPTCR